VLGPNFLSFSPISATLRVTRRIWLTLTLLSAQLVAACDGRGASQSQAGPLPPASSIPQAASTPPSAAIAHVPVGKFRAGSLPGEAGRRPELEPLVQEVELGPFRIDVEPYPGTPGTPPRVGLTRSEAEVACAERQGRLCTELEWERACKGPTSASYPTGERGCEAGQPCSSGFEVLNLGLLPEWTASRLRAGAPHANEAVVRGASRASPPAERRCAKRTADSDAPTSEIGFRCCYGAPNAKTVHEPELGPAYREVDVSLAELAALLESNSETRSLAKDATFFRSPDGARTVQDRGPGDTMGFTLTTKPLEWQPDRGLRLLVLAGRSGEKTSFVVAYHVTPDRKILAGSFVMKNEPGPIALAYAPSIRPRLHFSSCWGCPGETGKLLFRAPEEFVLLQP